MIHMEEIMTKADLLKKVQDCAFNGTCINVEYVGKAYRDEGLLCQKYIPLPNHYWILVFRAHHKVDPFSGEPYDEEFWSEPEPIYVNILSSEDVCVLLIDEKDTNLQHCPIFSTGDGRDEKTFSFHQYLK